MHPYPVLSSHDSGLDGGRLSIGACSLGGSTSDTDEVHHDYDDTSILLFMKSNWLIDWCLHVLSVGAAVACFDIAVKYTKVRTVAPCSEWGIQSECMMIYWQQPHHRSIPCMHQERQQFGSTIASYQNTQFKLADMAGTVYAVTATCLAAMISISDRTDHIYAVVLYRTLQAR